MCFRCIKVFRRFELQFHLVRFYKPWGKYLFKSLTFYLAQFIVLVGVNCHFDPFIALETIKKMKEGLEAAGLLDKVFLMCQPIAFHTPDVGKQGFLELPEFPFSLEPRICSRWDIHRYARQAYNLGVR